MYYPHQYTETGAGISLLIPVPEKIRLVYEELCRTNPGTPFPSWAKIWPAAMALSAFLQNNTELVKGKKLLEIGAGIGLPSFTAAPAASQIILSDIEPEAVELMKENIRQLGLRNATACLLDWNQFPDTITTDLLLLSDINYAPDQFETLLKLIHRFLQQGTLILLATPQRITASPFAQALAPFIRQTGFQTVTENGSATDIAILLLAGNNNLRDL